jgi:hypothetical protein
MAETALFSMMAVLMAFALISLIPIHRTRTAAAAAAYACAQFISQSPNPEWAAWSAYQTARQTLDADWSATLGAEYQVEVAPPGSPGKPGGCVVHYLPPLLFNIFGIQPQWGSEFFVSRSETWKAKWR